MHGHLSLRPRGTHLVCHCQSCAKAHAFVTGDTVSSVALYLTVPSALHIAEGGQGQLRAFQASRSGPFRWYTQCCRTPFANTLSRPTLPFLSFQIGMLKDPAPLGRVRVESHRPGGKGTSNAAGLAYGVFTRMVGARVSGKWRDTPFFDADGTPIVAPERASYLNTSG